MNGIKACKKAKGPLAVLLGFWLACLYCPAETVHVRHLQERENGTLVIHREEVHLSRSKGGSVSMKRIRMRADRFLIHLAGDFSQVSRILEERGYRIVDRRPFSPVFSVQFVNVDENSFGRRLAELKRLGRVNGFTVSRDYLAATAAVPNDPRYADRQDDLDLIGAPAAWDIVTGDSEVVAVIIDSGMDMDHADLAGNLFTNPLEIPGNGLDDDGNGLVDDIHGWDFYDNDSDPEDTNGHGTAMAGIIGAVGNNATGVAGTAWRCQLLPLRVGHDFLPWSSIIQALDYAVWLKARGLPIAVINNSYGSLIADQEELQLLQAAVDRVEAAGLLFVAAAGNQGLNNDLDQHFYPSDLPNPNILSVAATTNADLLSSNSNYGTVSVDMAAPGVSVHSTYLNDGYATYSGTSASCARVSGTAVLLYSLNGNLDYPQVRSLIIYNGDYVPDLVDKLANPVRVILDASILAGAEFPDGDWIDGPYELPLLSGYGTSLEVTVTDRDGTVSSVDFLADGLLLGTDTDGSDGWSWIWGNPSGSGTMQYRITDNSGNVVTSPEREYVVLSAFDFWRYGYWGRAFSSLAAADKEADGDFDGLTTYWEYAVDGNPLKAFGAGELSGKPEAVTFEEAGELYFGFALRLRTSDPELELYLESNGPGLDSPWGEIPADYQRAAADPDYSGFQQMTIGVRRGTSPNPLFLRLGLRFAP